ncbi:tail protein X [Halomonas sp. V046]|uniref:tail protein X n=1 Tax=Halomonas sp. V046 TaxID=3459611 RepID=UPI004043FF84
MAQVYSSRDGDTVDLVVWRYYGRQDARLTEQVLEANRHLADTGPLLPAGIRIILPDVEHVAEVRAGVSLWN